MRVTMRDIARKLNISTTTVSYVLNERENPFITDETRQSVLAVAKELGYRPNRLAQALARGLISVVVIYPDGWPPYYDPLVDGVREGVQELHDRNVEAELVAAKGSSIADRLMQVLEEREKLDGVVACLSKEDSKHPVWKVLEDREIPIVFLGGSVPEVKRLATVRVDADVSGRMAVEILGLITDRSPVAMFAGSRGVLDQEEKLEAFVAEAARNGLSVTGVYYTEDDPERSYRLAADLFARHPDTKGIYISTDPAEGVVRYLIDQGRAGNVKVVATGVFPAIASHMRAGAIQVSLFQNMSRQGLLALRALYLFLAERVAPQNETLVPPSVVLRNNLHQWL